MTNIFPILAAIGAGLVIMSTGLGIGYIAGGQLLNILLN